MNSVVLIGRLTIDPESRYIQGSNTAVAKFSLAIDRDYKNKDGTVTTDFIPIEMIGKPAEFCINYLKKGRLVAVQGSIRVDRYESNGEKKTYTKISGRNIQVLDFKKENNNDKSDIQKGYSAINDDEIPF